MGWANIAKDFSLFAHVHPFNHLIIKVGNMKLLRFGAKGAEKPGLLDNAGDTFGIWSGYVQDIGPAELSVFGLAKLAKIDPASLPAVTGPVRYGVPFSGTWAQIHRQSG